MTDSLDSLRKAVAGRYTVERELGRGGSATVYLAADLRHDRLVALKVLHPELAGAIGPARFLQEIRTTASLAHPHILPLLDSGETEGLLYYSMPFVDGESLRERLQKDRQLPLDEALRITHDVANALSYAHARGVVHRDIKPDNILLVADHAVVADFGIARAVDVAAGDRLTETGIALGTPAYMSPEQVVGERGIDGRCDVYALACVLYEMLAGDPPFVASNPRAVMARQLVDPIPPIATVRPDAPAAVAAALARALAKAPADRYATARAFADALSRETAEPTPGRKSIAVLPFANMSANPENEFLSDGISEEILNALTRLPDLRVAARTSAFTFKGKTPDIKEVGAKLRVATVLQGSVRKAGTRLRITTQLIDVAAGYQLWSERYDREMDDVFAIQDEIAAAVTEKLKVSLLDAAEGGARQLHTNDLEAYELYLRGRYFWNQRGAGVAKGLEYFQRAVERDPDYALAYAGMGDAYAMLGFWGGTRQRDSYARGKAAAQRALELKPELAEAHACLGFIAMYHDWDWTRAERELLLAIELEPRYIEGHLYYAQLLGWIQGDWETAMAHLRRAHDIDPLSVTVLAQIGGQLWNGGRFEEGLAALEKTLELAPALVNAHWFRGMVCRQLGRFEDAITGLERAIALNPGQTHLVGELALTLAVAGQREQAQAILNEAEFRDQQPFYTAAVHAALGMTDAAFEWLETAFARRDPVLSGVRGYRSLNIDREDPRYLDLTRRMGLT
jgi:serine/threonine-protein kinase